MKILVLTFLKKIKFEAFLRPSALKTEKNVQKNVMVAYVHIEYPTNQFSKESKGGWNPPPPGPCVTEKSVVLRGLRQVF